VAFQGIFYAFTDNPASIVNTGNYRVVLLRNPVAGSAATLSKVTYAVPFMGYLYVVGVYSDGSAHHFWLQNPPAWTANTTYATNTLVQPTTVNGYYYRALPLNIPPAWQPQTKYILNSQVQPSKYNGFYYKCTNLTILSPPTSGPNEPAWSTSLGGITLDFSAGNSSTNPTQINQPPTPPPAPGPGTGPGGRYGNRGGDGARIEQQ
jgi:hypothetical protein